MAIGEVAAVERPGREGGSSTPILKNLSYYSRLTDAESFQRAALVETERRGLCQAKEVAAVGDGGG